MKPNRQPWLIGVVIFFILAGWWWLTFPRYWEGFRPKEIQRDGDIDWVVTEGTYYSLHACKKEVEKTGGWCGKSCKDFRAVDEVADCDQLLVIPTKRSD